MLGPLPAGLDRPGLLAAVVAGTVDVADGARVVVALSGGPDSTSLAYLLAEARADLDLHLVHVRHGLRDDTEDRRIVARHATWLGLPLRTVEVEVVPSGHGRQAAARDARMAALRTVAADVGADVVALGHTADDQAETVLLRAARGTGTAGLAAMRIRRDDLVRPLLRVRRVDLLTFLDGEGLPTAEDPSNRDRASRRVRARLEVLPAVAGLAGDPVGALGRLAALAADDDAALRAAAAPVADAAVVVGTSRSVRSDALAPLAVAVRRRVTRQLVADVGGRVPGAELTERVEHLVPGRRVVLPDGTEVRVGGGWRTVAAPSSVHPPIAVALGGETAWSPAGVLLEAVPVGAAPRDQGDQPQLDLGVAVPPPAPAGPWLVPPGGYADRAHVVLGDVGPLTLRHRAPGDRIVTRGGTAKVARVLADVGVPPPVRDRWPVVVDDADRVRWVPGVAVDRDAWERGRVAPTVQLVVRRARGRG